MTIAIAVEVNPHYLPQYSDAIADSYFFTYDISIVNLSDEVVTLRKRYWHITDACGKVQEVSGDGVVGEEPTLFPGECFEYTSGVDLTTPWGKMHGHYWFEVESGEMIRVNIDPFVLTTGALLQ